MAATVKMLVEYIHPRGDGIFVRRLEKTDFRVLPGSHLGGLALRQFLSSPRIIKADGTPDLEVFAFCLQNPSEASRLKVEEEVLFEENPNAPKA